ncbi:phosducin family protein [Aphelenchoides avenae]|nr:phosducin family protein [Aphelenchus avenae]
MNTTLDEKILDAPNVGYCSDSDEETGEATSTTCNNTASSCGGPIPSPGRANTGPKGVLSDYELFVLTEREKDRMKEANILKEAERFALQRPTNLEEPAEEEDELDRLRRERLEQMRSLRRERIHEVGSKDDFLNVTEDTSGRLVLVHLYDDAVDGCQVLNEALLELSAQNQAEKFFKVKCARLGMTDRFTRSGPPTLQVYRNGKLLANLVRITDSLGDDFDSADLKRLLAQNGVEFETE